MNKKYTWHFIAWSIFILYQYIESYFEDGYDFLFLVLNTTYIITGIATFYFFYFLAWKPFLANSNKVRLLISIPLGFCFFVALRYFLEEVMCEFVFGFGNYRNDAIGPYFKDNVWRAFFYGSISLLASFLEQKQDFEKSYLQLQTEKSEAEMAFLRSQLNPHFIFNTLSYLHTKTFKFDPELAETVRKLSDMLRYSLESSKTDKVTIIKEIELLKNYIAIFQNRFEGKFFVNFHVEGTDLQQRIEPLLLIPFVENAFKHGIMNQSDIPANIKLVVEKGKIHFVCKNNINNYQKDKGSGIGMENVQRRLDLLYPDNYDLNIDKTNGIFCVDLKLNLSN